MMTSRRRQRGIGLVGRGFSLLELILVLAIVAVVAAIAVPRYLLSMDRYRAEAASRRIASDLALARTLARTSSESQSLVFSVSSNEYTLTGMPDLDRPAETYRVRLSDRPYHARLTSASFGASQTATFSGFGLPVSGGTVVVQSGGTARTVLLDAQTGEATVQ